MFKVNNKSIRKRERLLEKCNFDKLINYIRPECIKGEFIKITVNSLLLFNLE